MRRPASLLIAVLVVGMAATGLAAIGGRIYRNPTQRVQLEIPRGWEPLATPQIGFPGILMMANNGPSRLTLAVQRVFPGATAIDVAASARVLLERQGWKLLRMTPAGERVLLEARLEAKRRQLRQVYLVDGDRAFILSAAAPFERSERVFRDLDDVVQSLVLTPANATATTTANLDGGTTPDAATQPAP